ncbi:MAG TPA: ABC transporter substrate-binding protein [Fibrobacteria bacterium]|nr:ABC transporter substrate-binding protein [Fibrobacteria bacterium]
MRLSSFTVLSALVCAPMLVQAATDPVDAIRRHDQDLQSLLKRYQPSNPAQRDTLKHMINAMFSFPELGKRSLGKTWATLKKADQDSFLVVFRKAVESSSMKRLENYRADSTSYAASVGEGDRTTVTATVYRNGKSSKVVYKLFQQKGDWQAWDLILDDVSTLHTYKDQFTTIIAKEGFAGVLSRLRTKAAGD